MASIRLNVVIYLFKPGGKRWPKGSIHMEAGVLAQHGTLGAAKLVWASACTSIEYDVWAVCFQVCVCVRGTSEKM